LESRLAIQLDILDRLERHRRPTTTREPPGRLKAREHFTQRGDYVFCSRLGQRLDGAAVRRRYKRARDAIGLRPRRFHALRLGAGTGGARFKHPDCGLPRTPSERREPPAAGGAGASPRQLSQT
jgi:hypothetical protein